ncbi:MAG: 50S ribosomal protein L1 [bacterium]|nr:50S ribosomal protein L1 [bacterium]
MKEVNRTPVTLHSKKYRHFQSKIDSKRSYSLSEAIKLLKEGNYAKFDASVDVHLSLGFDQKKAEQPLRFTVKLPHGTGRERRILLFSDVTTEGVTILGTEETIKKIASGELKPNKDFDVVIATPNWMIKLAKVAKILGPQGLMPSPKTNTVTNDPEKTVQDLKKGSITVKPEPNAPVIHATVGRISFTQTQLQENLETFLKAVQVNKPAKIKGSYLKKVVIATTMSPGIRLSIDNK